VAAVDSVTLEISVVLGTATMPMRQLLRMGRGAVIELDSKQDDYVVLLANNRPIAKGDIRIQGDRIAISVIETLKTYDTV
jgi:flagellar motor switch protein FliN/FliY